MAFKVRGAPDEPTFDRSTAPEGASWAWSSRLDALKSMACAPLETESRERGAVPTTVADACCGHALLGLGMPESVRVIAIDRSALELVVAKQNVERAREAVGDGVVTRVTLREGDGLRLEEGEEPDVVVVAGVGANTMARVLEEGGVGKNGKRLDVVRRLVLNPPAKDGAKIRRWLAENGWSVRDERLVVENGTMHLAVSAERGTGDLMESLSLRDEIVGPILGQQSASESPLLKLYVKKRLEWVREVRRQAKQSLTTLVRRANADDEESIERLEGTIASYDDVERVLLEAMGLSIEEQRRRVAEQLEEQIARGFEGFEDEVAPGKLAFKTIDPGESDGRLGYCREFLTGDEARELLATLVASPPVEWAQRSIVVWQPEQNATKEVMQPRLVSWAGDLPYKYSGQTLDPVPVPDALRALMTKVEDATGEKFNHVLLNRYRDGSDSMALHADDEPELGHNACIAAVSIGHVRRFDVQIKSKTKKKTSIFLENGSLMVMDRALQHTHYHGVPKNHFPVEGERINITFRLLKGPPGWREGDE